MLHEFHRNPKPGKKQMPYTLSIESIEGKAKQYGFHLGTIERVAREVVQEKMVHHVTHKLPIVSMALKLNSKIVDVLYPDGTWHNG